MGYHASVSTSGYASRPTTYSQPTTYTQRSTYTPTTYSQPTTYSRPTTYTQRQTYTPTEGPSAYSNKISTTQIKTNIPAKESNPTKTTSEGTTAYGTSNLNPAKQGLVGSTDSAKNIIKKGPTILPMYTKTPTTSEQAKSSEQITQPTSAQGKSASGIDNKNQYVENNNNNFMGYCYWYQMTHPGFYPGYYPYPVNYGNDIGYPDSNGGSSTASNSGTFEKPVSLPGLDNNDSTIMNMPASWGNNTRLFTGTKADQSSNLEFTLHDVPKSQYTVDLADKMDKTKPVPTLLQAHNAIGDTETSKFIYKQNPQKSANIPEKSWDPDGHTKKALLIEGPSEGNWSHNDVMKMKDSLMKDYKLSYKPDNTGDIIIEKSPTKAQIGFDMYRLQHSGQSNSNSQAMIFYAGDADANILYSHTDKPTDPDLDNMDKDTLQKDINYHLNDFKDVNLVLATSHGESFF